MILELHAIQSFAPANLNRDDTGTPKEATFGGVRRARVSSQAWKRAMRMQFRDEVEGLVNATRTKRAHQEIVRRLLDGEPELDLARARHRAAVVLEAEPLGLGLVTKSEDGDDRVKTKQLVFFRDGDLDALAEVARDYADELDRLPSSLAAPTPTDGNGAAPPRAKAKAEKPKLSKDAANRIKGAMTSPEAAVDVALFGRMVAELPEANVDASCQVAHAIGTHRLVSEQDYYTAVDDLKPDDNEGADMIGVVEFNASCLYRYAAIDVDQLVRNLGVAADGDEVSTAVTVFTRAFLTAIPTGKQNTFAAHNPPSTVLLVRRAKGTWNLANAFVDPIDAKTPGGVATVSAVRMVHEFDQLMRAYARSEDGISAVLLSLSNGVEVADGVRRVEHIDELVDYASGTA